MNESSFVTIRDLALINLLIYYDPPKRMIKRVGCCLSAGMMARGILEDAPNCSAEGVESLRLIEDTKTVSESQITRYINHNDTNGFVAFALKTRQGENILAFRGSESNPGCAQSNIDWVDNILSPFGRSIQYADVERFVNENPDDTAICTGHSKGGHNAMYASMVSVNPDNRTVCFDAQGFSSKQLTIRQKALLKSRATNYVYRRDLVGALLCHPEKRVFVKGSDKVNAHSLFAIAFDLSGNTISSRQAILPSLAGFITCALPIPFNGVDTRQSKAE